VLRVKDGQRRIDENTTNVDVTIENVGVVDAACVLRRIDARHFPVWLSALQPVDGAAPQRTTNAPIGAFVDEAIVVAAGTSVVVRFVVDPSRLPGRASAPVPSRHVVPLVTSVVRYSDEKRRAQRRVLAIELATAGRLSLEPAHALMPFVAVERLEQGISHALRFENAGGNAVSIGAISTSADVPALKVSVVEGQGALVPAEGEAVVQLGLRGGAELRALVDERGPVDVTVRADVAAAHDDDADDDDGGEAPGWQSTLRLRVGRGPTLRADVPPVLHTGGRAMRAGIETNNPGHRPVRVVAVSLRSSSSGDSPDASPDPSPDATTAPPWIRLERVLSSTTADVDAGSVDEDGNDEDSVVVDAGGAHRFAVVIEPDRRADGDLDTALFEAVLRVEHDGYDAVGGVAALEVPFRVDLGRCAILDGATLGVDFGTSNSAVSMFHGASATIHALPLDRASGREALASLLFFAGGRGTDAIDGFLVGAAADNAAAENLTNLVRQLKSVVARAPQTAWHFVTDSKGIVRRSTHELLASFFGELKRRAEDGLRALPLSFLAELDLVDRAVRFRHAVFSHPVGADEQMIEALFRAAKVAGLADDVDLETFSRERCVDEALAASLSWVYLATQNAELEKLRDDERVLCFDAGGGTCDIAAVAVSNMASFRRHPGEASVRCRLLASGGDNRFGGTDIDRLFAEHLLAEVRRVGGAHAATIDDGAIAQALFYPSFEAWRRANGDVDGARSRATYHAAADLLRSAERLKKQLSAERSASVVVVFEAWPRRGGQGHGATSAADRVELTVSRQAFEGLVAAPFADAATRVDAIVDAAGWRSEDVTTVLFTGQTSHIPALRQAVLARLATSARRAPLNVVEPGSMPGFDVKRCVAQGASILGDSRRGGGGWLRVERRSQSALAMPLSLRRGPLLVPIDGLGADTPLPAKATVTLPEPSTRLVIYMGGAPAYEAAWDVAVDSVVVEVIREGTVEVVAGDVRTRAKRLV
jgi:hypothetical chaperone protein